MAKSIDRKIKKSGAKLKATRPVVLHVISDSTGNLASHALAAMLTQFPPDTFQVRNLNFVSLANIDEHLRLVVFAGGAVVHAVVDPELKARIKRACVDSRMACHDLTIGFARFLTDASGIEPRPSVRALHEVTEAYHRRIAAIEFTLDHDDGLGLSTLHLADVVLAGVSRTSKSPTSIYLGQHGFRTGNVALAIEVEPPVELLAMAKEKVIGLFIDPLRLADIRGTRERDWSLHGSTYGDLGHIKREVVWSKRLFAQQGWRTIDITRSAIEETAHRIMSMLGK